MRFTPVTILCGLLLCACTAPKKNSASGNQPETPPKITPAKPVIGKVALVNAELKYVVVDFSLGRAPVSGDVFSVYRMGMKVGEVRINSLSALANFAADITAGEAKVGDDVKKD
ncbi:MAG: hypothetical protein HY300_16055 [Verrucomicrobia bacterium]|nr:hypothetical protein [Verrucomicrobiota bacterium]